MTAQYRLVEITDPQLITYTRVRNSESWKGQLSEEGYVVRERVLGTAKIANSHPNRLVVFGLYCDGNDELLASCELLIREAWRYDLVDGKVIRKDVLSGCVGGVFCYPENRGKGLAKFMIDQLVEISKTQYVGTDGFTFLYSEIGEYYAKSGFKSFGVPLTNIPVEIHENDGIELAGKVEPLYFHQFDSCLDYYSNQLDRNIAAKVTRDSKPRVVVCPTSRLVDWFHLRSKYISYKLFYEKHDGQSIDLKQAPFEQLSQKFEEIDPKTFGLKLSNSKGDYQGSIIWTIDWSSKQENYATVLKIIVADGYDTDSTTLELLKHMKHFLIHNSENSNQTSTKIVLWESEVSSEAHQVIINKWNSKHGVENPSRSAILLNDDHDNELLVSGDLIWEGNDKLSWF